ncbi:hypothetical protein [Segetibacter koreensis]|uniref:hypothetical protein n=1 Tax=Segetibacter koreensis TaxID=398037 RepID=UPI00035F4CA5|nr:hypothetical protein [Segetibacter koreensis]
MKQVFNIGNLALLLAVVVVLASCQKTDPSVKKTVPFVGKFKLSIGEDGVHGTGVAFPTKSFTLFAKDNEENFPQITGTVTITASNGEQIFATHTGLAEELDNNMLKVHFDNTITGGTGRFTGATGHFDIDALLNEKLGTGEATIDGIISYKAIQ